MDFLGLTHPLDHQGRRGPTSATCTKGVKIDIDDFTIIDDARDLRGLFGERPIPSGLFQFESPGMQKYLRELQPSTVSRT